MKKTNTQKGITLIALIITIVVLLILAAVTIGAVRDSNIIGHAQNAATDYNQAKANELDLLAEYESEIDKIVNPPITKENGITIEPKALSIAPNESAQLTVTKEGLTETIYYSSSHANIATVSENGVVTGLAAGTTTITAKCGEYSATCTVTVVAPATQGIEYYTFEMTNNATMLQKVDYNDSICTTYYINTENGEYSKDAETPFEEDDPITDSIEIDVLLEIDNSTLTSVELQPGARKYITSGVTMGYIEGEKLYAMGGDGTNYYIAFELVTDASEIAEIETGIASIGQ